MPVDPEVLSALVAALQRTPDAVPLRLHLAGLLLDSGAEGAALEHYVTVLGQQPSNLAALDGAARACDRLGLHDRAAGYRAIHGALQSGSAPPPDAPTAPAAGKPADTSTGPSSGDTGDGDRVPAQAGDASPWWEVETSAVTWRDVGGMEDVKERLDMALLAPLRNPDLARAYGKVVRGGLVMYGPPGCGKTYLARATAGELGARFVSVGLSDILDMWLGESEKHLHEVFETARRNKPCTIFLDELDALGQRRTQLRLAAGQRGVVNQLLAEMDGVATDNEGVFVLAATNHPWDVDPALLRPGRFDRLVLVTPPDWTARAEILRRQLEERPVNVDVEGLAGKTHGLSGADLVHLCDIAIEGAMHEAMRAGSVRPVGDGDFQRALKEIKPSTRPWFETARNFVLFANDGGLYDPLLAYMRREKLV